MTRGGAARLALLGLGVGSITYPVYLVVMLLVALSTIPDHCSVFTSSSDCQDQNANPYLTITLPVVVVAVGAWCHIVRRAAKADPALRSAGSAELTC